VLQPIFQQINEVAVKHRIDHQLILISLLHASMTMAMENIANATSHRRPHKIPHFATIPNEAISSLTPYCGLILTICLVILFLIKHYVLERLVFRIFYRKKYGAMDDGLRRGFMNHHIAGGTKIVILLAGIKPFVDVVFGHSQLSSPFSSQHAKPKMGDVLLVISQLFVAMYAFELFYRRTLSPIAVIHHTGAIIIAQTAVVLSLDLDHEVNATMEFVLCLVWGAFDVLAEGWLNLSFILYRLYPESHNFLKHLFLSCCLVNVFATIAETILIMTLFGQSWEKWELSFKIVTPILHFIFTLAQLHGSKILFIMYKKQARYTAEEDRRLMDPESANYKRDNASKNGTEASVMTAESSQDSPTPPRLENADRSTKPSIASRIRQLVRR
jgi:hypothetical protein